MADDLAHWYKILELEPGASLEEVNQAYKDLAVVWHPDRLPQDSLRLQAKAQEKLKEINNARDRLREHQADRISKTSPSAWTRNSSTPADVTRTKRASTRHSAPPPPQQPRPTPPPQDPEPVPQPGPPPRPQTYPNPQASRTSNRQSQRTQTNKVPPQRPDLTGVDWSGMALNERDFSHRNLASANLSNTNLQDSFLHGTNLQGANLSRANLFRANLFQANLSYANLREANLIGADLSGADLRGADLTGARIRVGSRMTVRLIGANLTGTIMPDGNIYAKL